MLTVSSKVNNICFALIAFILFLVSCILHFYDLETMPPGIHVDEASVAYNAYCVSKTGTDEYGVAMPVFFKSFSNYQDPILIYTIIPFVKLFQMTKALVRIPSGIYHIMAALAFFYLSWKLIESRWISVIMAFAFSLLPWIFPVSRTCIGGYIALIFGTVCGIYFLLAYASETSYKNVILSAISFSFAFYSHHTGKLMPVIILLCFAVSFYKVLIKNLRHCLVFVFLLFILLLPMIFSALSTPAALTSRFNAISVWRDHPGFFEIIIRIIHRYIGYFAPQFLFISGDANYTHSTQYTGALFTSMAPFIFVGVFYALKRVKKDSVMLFLSLITLTYPIAASLTIGHRHGTACIGGSIYWTLFCGFGVKTIFDKIKEFKIKRFFLLSFFIVLSTEMFFYFKDYFFVYRESCRGIYGANVYDSLEKALKFRQKDETVYISKFVFFPCNQKEDFKPEFYAIILFLTKLDPLTYWKKGIPNNLVTLYDYSKHSRGILIRLDSLILVDDKGQLKAVKDYEQVPEKMILLDKILTPSGISIEINRIGGD